MASLQFIFIFFATIAMGAWFINAFSIQKDVCGNGQAPLAGYFCGRGPNRQACPSTHHCVIAPNDAYAVCCPNRSKREAQNVINSKQKSGLCPRPKSAFGICIARCTYDNECPGSQKCCGGCPRQCVEALSA